VFAGRHRHPKGTWGQVLGRGLVPRLSIGTLQLSIRCSSIHFLPSRSFPVSDGGVFEGKLAAFDAGRSSCLSWADAGNASQIANNETNEGLNKGAMHGLVNLQSLGATLKARRLIERCRDQPFHPKPAMHRAVSHPSWHGRDALQARPAGQAADDGC
jgi:hypothetical protein